MKTFRAITLITTFALVALTSASCVYAVNGANNTFTGANVMGLKVGLTTDEIVSVFGKPTRVKSLTCGGATQRGEWSCLIWEYDVEESYDGFITTKKTNTFRFNGEFNPPRLNDWQIEKMWK